MSNTIGIIQARMGSTRLPEKVLMEIGNEPMLWHVYERLNCASLIDKVVVATSTKPADDAIATVCNERDIAYYRGNEVDVLDRYFQAAEAENADTIVRVTADCPFLSPAVVDRVIRIYEDSNASYVSNVIEYTHPDGLDVEVFDFATLETAWEQATDPDEREHVTVYIRESDTFETENVKNVLDLSRYEFTDETTIPRWTVDYPEDLAFVRKVYDHLTPNGHWIFDQQSIFELLERKPELRTINDDR